MSTPASTLERKAPPAEAPRSAAITTRPVLGILAVLLGLLTITTTQRLLSVGLPDIQGALHLGRDEASWLNTVFNSAQMFIGPFSVYLGGLFGARKVLLIGACFFTALTFILPLTTGIPILLVLLALAGLAGGTFYPLTLTFVLSNFPRRYLLLGIAIYEFDVIFTNTASTWLEGFYMNHLSWHWLFWNATILTPIMIVLVYFGIPWQPSPNSPGASGLSFRGFFYACSGLALLYAAVDQGQRLDWWRSGTFVALFLSGAFLVLAAVVDHFVRPSGLFDVKFLLRRNFILLAMMVIEIRFVLLGTMVVIPDYLSSVQRFLPLQIGPVLLWVAFLQLVFGILPIYAMKYVDERLVVSAGFVVIAIACLIDSRLTSAWSGETFEASLIIMSLGLAFSVSGLVGNICLQVLSSGALKRTFDRLTFVGFIHTARLFGGEIGSSFLGHFLKVREQFHSNILVQYVNLGSAPTMQALSGLRSALSSHSPGMAVATGRAADILAAQVKVQAYTLAVEDSFVLIAWAAVVFLVLVALLVPAQTDWYSVVTSDPTPASA